MSDTTMLGVGVEVRKSPPYYPNHSKLGRIISRLQGGFEVKWNDNTITQEPIWEIEAH